MKKNNNAKTICTIISILIIFSAAGCGPQTTQVEVNVHEGTEGLEIKFMERSPPDEVYVNEKFPWTVELSNKGAVGIGMDRGLIVVGVESEYVQAPADVLQSPIRFALEGRSLYNPVGGYDRRTVHLTAKELGPQMEVITTNVAATLCYPYKTEAVAQVCVDADLYNEREEQKSCSLQDLSMGTVERDGQELPRGQGAPIAVTRIEQKMLAHDNEGLIKPVYMIYVKNMGGGIPVEISSYDKACSGIGAERRALNVIRAKVYLSDRTAQLDCTPKSFSGATGKDGYLQLEEQEDYIRCSLEEGVSKAVGTYTTPLLIDLEYGYTMTISKPVLIKKHV